MLGIGEARLFAFVLMLFRIGGMFSFAPIYGSTAIPVRVRSALALGLTYCLTALGIAAPVAVPISFGLIAALVIQEMILGILFGYVATLVFAAAQLAGQVVGMNMGLGIVSVMDPQFEVQVSVITQVKTILATLLFLSVGGERLLLEAFAAHFASIPPGHLVLSGPLLEALTRLTGEIFRIGLQMAAPVIAAMFGANVILGIFARSVPQMNMLILGFPLKIFVGFALMALSLPYVARVVLAGFAETFEALGGLQTLFR